MVNAKGILIVLYKHNKLLEIEMRNNVNFEDNKTESNIIEGRNAVIEAFRSGKTVDKVLVLEGCQDGPINTIVREAKKQNVLKSSF